ncbi:hypothetical protein [Paenibacillus cremeus]|uniref:2',3'-cyclic-nucleotide 2'-phosphodiesterase n=1 Tax=Paenibacillus cremeus TaxID=2163881 RepID=A0A559KEC1_9BACL|nr:hypothetical protein [Paenibacillus cremeus]TVY10477.1 hypothetical protein FPZ49_08780 [Paenibacillus cremeus]
MSNDDFESSVLNIPHKRGFKTISQLTILYTSDIHGYVYPTTYADRNLSDNGLSGLLTLKETLLQVGQHLLLLDGGDLIQGSPLTFYRIETSSEQIKSEVDYVIVLYHGGFEADLETGVRTEATVGENQGYQLL